MFPRLLRERGYATAAIGKMHFYPTYASYGFDHMELSEQNGPGRYEDDYHRWLANRGRIDLVDLIDQEAEFRRYAGQDYLDSFGARASDLPEELHSTTWAGDRAVAYLERAEPPFCLWLGFIKPHHPFDPPARWLEVYDEEKLSPLPGWTETIPAPDAGKRGYFEYEPLTLPTLRRVMAHYYATISHVDAQIGRVLQVLRRRGLEDTVVIYTADHGEFLGYHHLLLKGAYLYEPLVRVPLVMARLGEGNWAAGRRENALVESIDVTSTFLASAGVEQPSSVQGCDLTPVLRGERDEHRETVFSQSGGMSMQMLRAGRWKLIQAARERDRMLFDLKQDPTELRNLYDEPGYRDVGSELERRLLERLCGEVRTPSYAQAAAGATSLEQGAARGPAHRGLTPYAAASEAALRELARRAEGEGA
jgi:arylsulfatase A-like enzyme